MDLKLIDTEIIGKAKRIKVLLMDCDGVLTDGRLYFSESGEAMKAFDVRDGQGIVMLREAGFKVGVITGRQSEILNRRAEELKIDFVRQGVSNKLTAAREILLETGNDISDLAYIGDDLPDVELIKAAGLGIAVADAVEEAKGAADFVTVAQGGRGAVREIADLLLEARV